MSNTKAPQSIHIDFDHTTNLTTRWEQPLYCEHLYSETHIPSSITDPNRKNKVLGISNWTELDLIRYKIFLNLADVEFINTSVKHANISYYTEAMHITEPSTRYYMSDGTKTLLLPTPSRDVYEPFLIADFMIKDYKSGYDFKIQKNDGTYFHAKAVAWSISLSNIADTRSVKIVQEATYLGTMQGDELFYDPQ